MLRGLIGKARRQPPANYSADHVFRWDLDKTYLRSEFDSARDLLKSAFESPQDKRAYPGARSLLRALGANKSNRVCIVSGSPSQMRGVLSAKLALDGVPHHEFVLKNNLRNILRGRFRAIRAQIPYKLPALLMSRQRCITAATETLFGDDAEADAIVYSLYADVLAGQINLHDLERVLAAARAYDDEIKNTLRLAETIKPQPDAVGRIIIHLDQRSPTATFARYGRRLVPVYNYFQAALILYKDGKLSARQLGFVAQEMLDSGEFTASTLATSLQDLIRRGRIKRTLAERLALELDKALANVPEDRLSSEELRNLAWAFAERIRQLGGAPPMEWPERNPRLDYVSLVDHEHSGRREKRRQRMERS